MGSLSDLNISKQFGKNIKKEFLLNDNFTHFNNGSFGTVPKVVREARIKWLDLIEEHPDNILADQFHNELDKAINKVAKFVNADPKDVTFVSNATEGINAVLRSFGLKEGDIILHFSSTYAGVKYLLKFLKEKYGIELVQVQHDNVSDNELIEKVKETLQQLETQNKKVNIAVVDAIASVPGVIIPFNKLTEILQEHGAKVLIDGAHAFGQIKLDLKSLKADYFVTNLHKWGYAYRPTALLYVNKQNQKSIHPTVVTYGYGDEDFKKQFSWPGTLDFSCWLSSSESIDFINHYGEENIQHYIHTLAWEGGNRIAKLLGTEVWGEEHQVGGMVNIRLPINGEGLEAKILKEYGFRVKIFQHQQDYWLRLSAQIFLELEDFDKVGNVILKIKNF